ncbi:MAG: glycosyltransferase family 4 protein [Scytonematopsis contorta HA4267-MV1]|jgi:glycosyltransferase involved in cell wall biosynthesis|nr:glycosyltransferase family 4 protein [Scytonematopsis contorta HA4267-MV1]
MRVLGMPAFRNRDTNPYNWLLYTSMKKLGTPVEEFSLKKLLLNEHHIWHLHWPEMPLNNPNKIKAFLKIKALFLQIDCAKMRGAKIVWTAHNLANHERLHLELETQFWRGFLRRIDGYISLSQAGIEAAQKYHPELKNIPGFVIPHNHYRDEYPDNVSREKARTELGIPATAKVLLFFGRIRAYKNVPQLLQVFQNFTDPNSVLYIAGKAEVPGLAEDLAKQAKLDSRLQFDLDFISHEKAQLYFRAADLVVLPYREILNSGTALLSLSFNCPVLVPKRGAMGELQNIVGSEWVRTYEDNITPEEIAGALEWALNTPRAKQAPLENFDLNKLAQQTIEAYNLIAGN